MLLNAQKASLLQKEDADLREKTKNPERMGKLEEATETQSDKDVTL